MNSSDKQNEKIAKMTFASIYPHYLSKVEKKGRTKEELHHVITWLTGFNEITIQEHITQNTTFETFFKQANLNTNVHLIKGSICGVRIEEIENELTKNVRYLDKLVDELAKGKNLDKILRK